MQTHKQLRELFAGVMVGLATLAIVITTVHPIGAEQSKKPVATLPEDAGQAVPAPRVVQPKGNIAEHAAVNGLQKTRIEPQATTAGAISFLPAVAYYSGAWDAYSVAVADVNGDGKPDVLVANYCIAMTNC